MVRLGVVRPMSLNIQQNRDQTKYPTKIQLLRVLWAVVRPLFRWSPRPCFGWRAFLLRIFGAKIGRSVHIYNSVQVQFPWNLQIDDFAAVGERAILYNLGQLRIGHSATISQGSHLCGGSHDYTSPDMILLCEPITIEASAWFVLTRSLGQELPLVKAPLLEPGQRFSGTCRSGRLLEGIRRKRLAKELWLSISHNKQ